MTQWAEIRHLHLVEGVSKKQIARRLQLDIKTVRRAWSSRPRRRGRPRRGAQPGPVAGADRAVAGPGPAVDGEADSAAASLPLAGPVAARTVRRYVAALKVATAPKEATCTAACVLGRRWRSTSANRGPRSRECRGRSSTWWRRCPTATCISPRRIPLERLESLLDGIESAFTYFGGVVDRVVLDNTSLAVKAVLAGRDRLETEAFAGHCQLVEGSALLPREIDDAPDRFQQAHVTASQSPNARVRSRRW